MKKLDLHYDRRLDQIRSAVSDLEDDFEELKAWADGETERADKAEDEADKAEDELEKLRKEIEIE